MTWVIYLDDEWHAKTRTKSDATRYINKASKNLKIPKTRFKMRKLNPPKYRVGQMVYSWQNPTVKRAITKVLPSNDPKYPHKYKVGLRHKNGYSYSSKWISEKSISLRKLK